MKHGIDPLHIRSFLKGSEKAFTCVPWLDGLLICFGFMLLSSKFLLAPGVAVELPQLDAKLVGVSTSAVLSFRHNQLLIFDDRIFDLETLEAYWLGDWQEELATEDRPKTLLLKADKHVSVDAFLRVCELAQRSGFAQVQVAAREASVKSQDITLIDFDF
ncbi:MAG: hypothetical protein Tsb0018_04720 [Opitutales bacterium]